MIYVLDTTAVSAAMRFDREMLAFLRARRPGRITTVPPVVAEIEYGVARLPPNTKKRGLLEAEKERLLSAIPVLNWSPDASRRFGATKASLESSGMLIDDFDVAVAAIAMAHGAEVVTANLVHFSRVEGLAVRHWTE